MVRLQSVALLALALVSFGVQDSAGYCPNGCNAQGTCGRNDKCTCYLRQDEGSDLTYPAYKGADCSMRTCPFGDAWVSMPTALNTAHPKMECSNKGYCDYTTGQCDCFPGYEGKACERTVCPNNCNNRGICLTLQAIIANDPDGTPPGTYQAWDAIKHMGCYCDQGYRGPDCSLKECPSGADVLLAYGKAEGRDCGGRGRCNYETGDCECFPGYYGTACESQTTVH
ncbi:hypothetical protein P43SY_000766 [Pythium insidiosum]|uniref:EGF-like domain-containing protein n=1 Tax=Pythium insidiosum TaxID=114742 RepID=A0AAD5LXT6_PYTIN|nr:hypothetical protein P43SY_000766 [Pythium insidiosum]